MIRLLGNIPKKFYVAVSGGSDSMTALAFFANGRKDFEVIHFDHRTDFGAEARAFVTKVCENNDIKLHIGELSSNVPEGSSTEDFWHHERYKFFHSFDAPVITAQHLDDACEWYLFSALHGEGKITPYRNGNVIRPFLQTPKSELQRWASNHNIPYLDDPGNNDERYMRSIVRHKIMPEALRVNPGLRTVVKKRIANAMDN